MTTNNPVTDRAREAAPERITYNPIYQVTYEGADPTRGHVYILAGQSVPEGYVLVPREPTEAMLAAWATSDKYKDDWRKDCAVGWSAMLAATPAPSRDEVEKLKPAILAQLQACEDKAAHTLWAGSPLLKGLAEMLRHALNKDSDDVQ